MPNTKISLFAFDTETTGLVPGKDEIISLAYITLDEQLDAVDRGCIYAHPSRPDLISPEVQAINGYTRELWTERGAIEQPQLKETVLGLWKTQRLSRVDPLGHNVKFDLGMLEALVGQEALNSALGYHAQCTVGIAKFLDKARQVKGARYKLEVCCARFGVELTHAHDAMADITATVQLYRKLVLLARNNEPLPEPKKESFLVKEAAGGFTFRNGKYKGTALAAVPKSYLQWALENVKPLQEDEIIAMLATRDMVR